MPREVFDIFLSSTSSDLQAYRDKVRDMVDRLRQTAIRMESFGARPDKPLDACRRDVQKCDALIVIVGHRYGWIPGKSDGGDGAKSITWWEVQWALQAQKPVYAFLVDPKSAWIGEREQDRLTTARSAKMIVDIGRSVQQLQKFRAFLERKTVRELFSSAEDLASKVATSLHTWLVEQALASARAEYSKQAGSSSASVATHVEQAGATSGWPFPLWREQAHFFSAHDAVKTATGVMIAVIAGRANGEHPALRSASIQHIDAYPTGDAAADDYTTALAGLLVGEDAAVRYRGAAPGAELLVLRVLDQKLQTTSAHILAALDTAVREGAKVICMTLAGPTLSNIEEEVYERIGKMGIAVVSAAGNRGDSTPLYPAAFDDSIAVAAVDPHNQLAPFSGRGTWVDTAAPGTDILVPVGADRYELRSGTSFSCALVAGAVALALKMNAKLTVEQIKRILRTTGQRVLESESTVSTDLRGLSAIEAIDHARRQASATGRRGKGQKSR